MSNRHSPALICSKIVSLLSEMETKIGEVEQLRFGLLCQTNKI